MTTGDLIENYEGWDMYTVSERIVVACCLIDRACRLDNGSFRIAGL